MVSAASDMPGSAVLFPPVRRLRTPGYTVATSPIGAARRSLVSVTSLCGTYDGLEGVSTLLHAVIAAVWTPLAAFLVFECIPWLVAHVAELTAYFAEPLCLVCQRIDLVSLVVVCPVAVAAATCSI